MASIHPKSSAPNGTIFPGFQTGGALCDTLNKDHNQDLKLFAKELFQQISTASKSGRKEAFVQKDRIFLDAVSQILTGNEVCAAIAISGSSILIATNQGKQDKRTVSWSFKTTILDKSLLTGSLRLGFTCCIQSDTGEKLEKQIGPVTYQLHAYEQKARIIEGNQKLEFVFSQGEFAYLPDDEISIKLTLFQKLDLPYFQFLLSLQNGEEIEIQKPVVTCRGALYRRTAKLFYLLSAIANAILQELPWRPENSTPQTRHYSAYLEKKYREYKQTHTDCTEDGFLDAIQLECVNQFHLDQGKDTSNDFFDCARDHYRAIELKERVFRHLDEPQEWVKILNDSLTYELSRLDFADDIHIHEKNSQSIKEMQKLYSGLVKSYKKYKDTLGLTTSVPSVMNWFDSLKDDYHSLPLPAYIEANFDTFHTTARRYFIQLAFVEQYIKENAQKNGSLARRFAKENIFKKPDVILVDGKEGVHAEMRLFSYHLLKANPTADYYGIAKLCCALCNYTFKQFETAGIRPPETRGTHAMLYTWPLPEAFRQDLHMRRFLGSTLSKKYPNSIETRRIFSKKKGDFYNLQEVYQAIVCRLDGLNSEKNLRKLGLDKKWIIQGSQEHYADNAVCPALPLNHEATIWEEKLNKLTDFHGSKPHVELFEPLQKLGFAWRRLGENSHTVYYLVKAAHIFDLFPECIDLEIVGTMFNILGNACKGLKLYDTASTYLLRALEIKRKAYKEPHTEIVKTLINLGSLHYEKGEYNQAYSHLIAAKNAESGGSLSAIIQRNLSLLDKTWKISLEKVDAETEQKENL